MDRDLVEVRIDDDVGALWNDGPERPLLGRGLLVVAALLVAGGAVLSVRPAPEPAPTEGPSPTPLPLLGATASLDTPWRELWQAAGTAVRVDTQVVVSGPDGTGAQALDVTGTPVWGPVAVGLRCSPSGSGVVCLGDGSDRRAVVVSALGKVVETYQPGYPVSTWWVVGGDVVSVGTTDGGSLAADRWVPSGHRGAAWSFRGTGRTAPDEPVARGRTWLRVGATVLDLSTGLVIASPADAVKLPAWGAAVLGPSDESGTGVPIIVDGTDVVVLGVRHYPGPAQLIAHGVLVTGEGTVSAHRLDDGARLWSVPASAAVSDGTAAGLLEPDGTGQRLVARNVTTGAELWHVALPAGTLAGVTSTGIVLDTPAGVVFVGP